MPELPASRSRVTLLRSSENVDYTQGVFILNEDWFGHNNSTINFMTSSGDFAYRIFQTANPGKELGCTSQFGTIFGDNMLLWCSETCTMMYNFCVRGTVKYKRKEWI